MSRRLAVALFSLAFATMAGTELPAIRNKPQRTDAGKKPADASTQALNRGLARLQKADKLETKNPNLARKEYAAALGDFQAAATAKPDDYRAHNGAGYALRKLGEYDRALQSYDRALSIAPASIEAIEYRAEAYLGLNRLDEVKQAYIHLFVHDRAASNVLMGAMKAWAEGRRVQPGNVDPATVAAFDGWVRERATLAASVVHLGHNSPDWK